LLEWPTGANDNAARGGHRRRRRLRGHRRSRGRSAPRPALSAVNCCIDDRCGWLCDRLVAAALGAAAPVKESVMSVYRVTEIIGTSSTSWEDAAAEAIRTAAGTLRDLRVAEVVKQDIHLDEGGAITYRTKLQLSFKYEAEH
jgi:dodecin